MAGHEIPIRHGDAFAQRNPRLPADVAQAAHVKQLPRRTIRLAGIESDAAGETDHRHHGLGKFEDGDILADTDVVDAINHPLLHEEDAAIRQVVELEE